jgi:hypothetical protein
MGLLTMPRSYIVLTISVFFAFAIHSEISEAEENATPESAYELTVYKSPTCGCCGLWIDYMKAEGFQIDTQEQVDVSPVKKRYNIKPEHWSCHTAVFEPDNYFFEGHVPADAIKRFIREKPEGAIGLIVAGMPPGSPGMVYNDVKVPYDVLMMKKDGSTTVYEHMEAR